MPLKKIGTIAIPNAAGSAFDHGAFDARSRRVFIAHTARDCLEVIDHDLGKHIATLPGFPGVAGAVADDGQVLVTNRGSGQCRLLDAGTLETPCLVQDRRQPNGAVVVARSGVAIAACIGDDYGNADASAIRIEGSPTCVDRLAGAAALVRHRCCRGASVPVHPRAIDGAGGPLARSRRGDALESALGRRTRPRHRSCPEDGFTSPATTRPWSR